MDILEMLTRDHKIVSFLLSRLNEPDENSPRKLRELFDVLKEELEVHTDVEESVFYPAIKEEASDLIEDALHTHNAVADLLRELETSRVDSYEWMQKLSELQHYVDEHVKHEEQTFFERARELMDVQQLVDLGAAAQRHRQELFALK